MLEAQKHVIIVGGGLAGMACAVALVDRGVKVTLLESRFALGGRAGSFEDQEHEGELLDNCQHVLLGCCTNLIDLYQRMGVSDKVGFHKRVHFLDERGGRHDLWAVRGLPSPLHLGPSMALFSALNFRERRAVVRAMLAMLRLGRSGRAALENKTFGEWLDENAQSAALIRKFYDPIVISALNEETRRGSAKYAIQVFQEAMLANRRGYIVGLPACPLGELYAKLPPGIDLRLNSRVDEILWETINPDAGMPNMAALTAPPAPGVVHRMRAAGVKLRGGEELRADAVVLATNHHAVQRWAAALPETVRTRDERFTGLEKLESVPILGVHLWFDRPVMPDMAAAALIEPPNLTATTGGLQWLFRKDAAGSALHGVISAARAWVSVPKEDALRQFEAQVRTLFPAARDAKLERGVIVIEKRATFSPAPGTDACRPGQSPSPPGVASLYLAGDYTRTDWPATMEGAVRSGYLAAEGVLRGEAGASMDSTLLKADLPIEWPARWMGL